MHYDFQPKGVCSTHISFDIEDGKVYNVKYENGCNGNLQAIGRLVDGMEVDGVVKKLKGIHCGFKDTSCGDQLATALLQFTGK